MLTYTEYGYMLFTYKDKTIKIYKNSINGYKVYKAFDNLLKGYVIDFGIQGDDSYISISLPEPDTSMKIPLSAVTITLTDNCCIRLSWLGFVILVDPAAAYVNVNVAVSNRKLKCNTLLNRRTTNSSELLRALVNYVDKRRLS